MGCLQVKGGGGGLFGDFEGQVFLCAGVGQKSAGGSGRPRGERTGSMRAPGSSVQFQILPGGDFKTDRN